MSKQTAVEWYIKESEKIDYEYTTQQEIGILRYFEIKKGIEAQAKQMEKEQIVNAYNESFRLRDKPYSTAVKYYNETYGGKDE
jgi:hypothetical protein